MTELMSPKKTESSAEKLQQKVVEQDQNRLSFFMPEQPADNMTNAASEELQKKHAEEV